ncbi:MAG: DASH family cryptochrome [Sphingobacteriaceae bacterium]|nr:MAG: DASH family cryptochrome [Sphingobacteriaceae bacterium]
MPEKKIALVWFKTNLRLRDNECLFRALAENDEVIPFYCFDDQVLQTNKFGFKKTGNIRLNFLKENLLQLDNELRKAGSGLVLLHGSPETEIVKLASKYFATSIYSEKEVAPEELQTAKKTAAELAKVNCEFLTFECRNLFHTADLPFPVSGLPEIFTEFRKKVEKATVIRPLFTKPLSIASPPISALSLTLLQELIPVNVQTDPRAAMMPLAFGAAAAHQRLHYYFYQTKALSTYKETRNGLVGEKYSTKFSAWLAMGCISAKEIYYEIKAYEDLHRANESTYWLFFELLWRDYFGFCMEKNPLRYFSKSGNQQTKATDSKVLDTELHKWINGQTGEPFIDANMTELKLTGFMSNRGRQNVASYLCNDLKLDWRYGAAYFEQQLIDYDVCSNWCNWAYVAGVGNDPRANRYFNIAKQAATYDADKRFRQLWAAG